MIIEIDHWVRITRKFKVPLLEDVIGLMYVSGTENIDIGDWLLFKIFDKACCFSLLIQVFCRVVYIHDGDAIGVRTEYLSVMGDGYLKMGNFGFEYVAEAGTVVINLGLPPKKVATLAP